MTGRPTYLPLALNRIEALGEPAIAAFFSQIRRELLKVVTGFLPPLPGFRPGTNAAVQRQLQSLARKIATYRTPSAFSHSPEEVALYQLWRAWSQSQLAETAVVRELLDGLEEDDDDESGSPDKLERMTTALKALVSSGTCARETLEQFVTFSPFEHIDDLLVLLRGAHTRAEIERDSTLRDLPDRLHKDEARLQLLETKLDAFDRNATLMRSEVEELRRGISDLRTKGTQERASDMAKALEMQQAWERLTHSVDDLAARITTGEKHALSIAESHRALESQVVRAGQLLNQLSEQAMRLEQNLVDLQTHSAELKSRNERFSDFEPLAARIGKLEEALTDLQDSTRRNVPAIEPVQVERTLDAPAFESGGPALMLDRLTLDAGLSSKSLHSVPEILSSLDAALVEAGLKKSMATVLAEEILAAAASEQVVFFRGGLAVDVARRCALSLTGPSAFRLPIPIGLTDATLLSHRLGNRPDLASGNLSSIVVEGINNAPLDLLRDVLLDEVSSRVGRPRRQYPTIIFASLVDGAGAFPLEPSYLELGPVFDLELVDWRRMRRDKLAPLACIADAVWQSIPRAWEGKIINYEEALQGARQLTHKRNVRFETNVVSAFSALKTIRRDQGLTALQSVTFGWLAPYWRCLSAKADDIDAQIDGGKCDGTNVDERLQAFLAEYRALATGVA